MDDCVLCIDMGTGLHKLWNPAIPDERTYGKFGEHGGHGTDGKRQGTCGGLL